MLVLSRKRFERLLIGPDIRITIVKVDRSQVRLGIEAPADHAILREELVHPEREPESEPESAPAPRVDRPALRRSPSKR